jgi:hypothetical protein
MMSAVKGNSENVCQYSFAHNKFHVYQARIFEFGTLGLPGYPAFCADVNTCTFPFSLCSH